MRRLSIIYGLLPLAALLVVGCSPAPEAGQGNRPDARAANTDMPTAATSAPLDAGMSKVQPRPAVAPVVLDSKDDILEFGYRWPAAAAGIAPLDKWLRDHADTVRKRARDAAMRDSKSAQKGNYPFHAESYVQRWATVADTPALLVLQADGYVFTGGAHGMPFVSTLIWDKAAGKRLATAALVNIPALARAEKDRFCKALDAQRAEKRGPAADSGPLLDDFTRCVDMTKQELVPVSKGGNVIDTARVVILPYEAGPYAEGIYTIDLPLDDKARSAVAPAWRAAFAAR